MTEIAYPGGRLSHHIRELDIDDRLRNKIRNFYEAENQSEVSLLSQIKRLDQVQKNWILLYTAGEILRHKWSEGGSLKKLLPKLPIYKKAVFLFLDGSADSRILLDSTFLITHTLHTPPDNEAMFALELEYYDRYFKRLFQLWVLERERKRERGRVETAIALVGRRRPGLRLPRDIARKIALEALPKPPFGFSRRKSRRRSWKRSPKRKMRKKRSRKKRSRRRKSR